MALTKSTMLTLGTPMPSFRLPDVVSGDIVSPESFSHKKGILVMFICRHCPYVLHVKEELAKIGQDYKQKNLGLVAVSSNDAKMYQDDSPDQLRLMAEELQLAYPLCFDESQETAKIFTAACTPDFFLFGQDQRLVYRGQLDESRPGNGKPVDGKNLRAAIEAVLTDQPVPYEQWPSTGCSIKWIRGNEPSYV